MMEREYLLRYRNLTHPNASIIWKSNLVKGDGNTGRNGWFAVLKPDLVVNGCGGLHTFTKDDLFCLLETAKKGKVQYAKSWASDTSDHMLFKKEAAKFVPLAK